MGNDRKRVPRPASALPIIKEDGKVKYGIKGTLSKNEVALLEQYKSDKGVVNIVQNTIDEVIKDNIGTVKEMVDNMVAYGDPKVFKLLPKDLDEKMRAYGMEAQDYFGKKSVEMRGQAVYVVPVDYKQCNRCGGFKPQTSFYVNYSDSTGGYSCICKECCDRLFRQYLQLYSCKESLMVMCQKLDTVVVEPILSKYVKRYSLPKGKEEVAQGAFFGNFISENNMYVRTHEIPQQDSCFCRTNLHGEPFRRIEAAQILPQIYNDVTTPQDDIGGYENTGTYKPIRDLKRKWGNFDTDDLYWLEDKYDEWYDRCEIDGLSREKLVIQLCHEELDIFKSREKKINVKDKIKNFQTLMKEADLTPKRQTMAASESQFQSFGTLIKTAEQHGPIIVRNEKFEDVDKFGNLWRCMVGAISRTLGKKNEYVKEFEDSYKSYTADFSLPDDSEVDKVEEQSD